jgi:topoisomerase IA-like protein
MKLLIGGLDKNGFLLPTDLGEQNRTSKMIHCQLAGPHGPLIRDSTGFSSLSSKTDGDPCLFKQAETISTHVLHYSC